MWGECRCVDRGRSLWGECRCVDLGGGVCGVSVGV